MEKNERKLAVLELMASCDEVTTLEVWEMMDGLSYPAMGMVLLRYHWQGLLSRSGAREKTYRLTAKGEARLRYLRAESG